MNPETEARANDLADAQMDKYLIFYGSPVFHVLKKEADWFRPRIPTPLCGYYGSSYMPRIVHAPQGFLRPCKNCGKIINDPDAIRRKKNYKWWSQ